MGDPKNPWDDVPIEVLIEYERKKREEEERSRPRIQLPVPLPIAPPRRPPEVEGDPEEECKIVIKLF